jgi:hypothetical protein
MDQLDDETLALIVRPELKVKVTYKEEVSVAQPSTASPSKVTKVVTEEFDGTIFDQAHPNCLVFSSLSRLFVGDSRGTISVWDVELRHGKIIVENHFKLTHKELEGD